MFSVCEMNFVILSLSHLSLAMSHLNDDAKKKMSDIEIDSQLA